MRRIRLHIEYEGSAFAGFQRQARVTTVQSELENAIWMCMQQAAKRRNVTLGKLPAVNGSGRTDSGVHAFGQVVSFRWPEEIDEDVDDEFKLERLRRAIDGITCPELSIRCATFAEQGFDPRKRVICKQYSYHLLNRPGSAGIYHGRVWWIRTPLDIEKMIHAAHKFRGTHDFTSFRAGDCTKQNPVRTILRSEFVRVSDDEFVFLVQGKGFLKQMIRIMTGTLVEVGRGKMEIDDIDRIFLAKSRTAAAKTAPAQGLVLDWVRYEGE